MRVFDESRVSAVAAESMRVLVDRCAAMLGQMI